MGLIFGATLPQREFKNDVSSIREFALGIEELGLSYLRVADQVIEPKGGGFHEPLMLLSYLSAATSKLELVPSVLVAPSRQTALLAKQIAELDLLSDGRIRLGLGLGGNLQEYRAMGRPMARRGRRLEEQILLLRNLWRGKQIYHKGEFEKFNGVRLSPRLKRESIPIWLGLSARPPGSALKRVGTLADGWFAMCDRDSFESLNKIVLDAAERNGRSPSDVGAECEISILKHSSIGLRGEINRWIDLGVTHICLSTLGFLGDCASHLDLLAESLEVLSIN